tara:strand:- start:117 stop:284 length:168 start_codon:yes stop_codon:yes gene_type:complete
MSLTRETQKSPYHNAGVNQLLYIKSNDEYRVDIVVANFQINPLYFAENSKVWDIP